MARGIDEFIKVAEANSKEFEKREYAPEIWPGLRNDGDSIVVRFLENSTEFEGAYFHMAQKVSQNGKKYFQRYLCLDQENESPGSCPACVAGIQKSFKGFINVVWYDAPVYQKDDDGKLVKTNGEYVQTGVEDINAIWIQGITVFKSLHTLDLTYNGLTNNDFRIIRSGKDKKTQYNILPVPGEPQEIDPKFIENKHDLSVFTQPSDLAAMQQAFLPGQGQQVATPEAGASPFLRKNRFDN